MNNLSRVTCISFFFLLFSWDITLALEKSYKIDINTANTEALQEITGIGPVLADRIVQMRKDCYFYPLSSLTAVKGIGPTTLDKIEKEGKAFVSPPARTGNITLCGNSINNPVNDPEKVAPPLSNETDSPSLTQGSQISLIDINTASLEELVKIVHIGQTRVQQIISLRPFYSLDDLTKIRGIGPKSLEDIKIQGLAWVDPNLKPPKVELSQKNLTAQANPFSSKDFQGESQRSLGIFLIALGLAAFSGAIMLILKKKLKNI